MTAAKAHFSDPTWVTMMLPKQVHLAARQGRGGGKFAQHHDGDKDRADDDTGQR